jgi:transcriptional regulator with XRE-family HTH domain
MESRQKKVTQQDLARLCKVDQGSVSRILNKDTRDSFADDTVKKVFRIARESGYLHPALVSSNRRASPRKKAAVLANVSMVIGANTVFDSGVVEVDEVSMSGMLLRGFQTRKQSMPMDRFRFDVEVTNGKLKGFRARCQLVRFTGNENEFAVAVKYDVMDNASVEKLKVFLK